LNKNFKIIAKGNNTYNLYDPDNHLLLTGYVGKSAATRSEEKIPVNILVSSLFSNPGTEFQVKKNPVSKIVKSLQKNLSIMDVGSTSQINNKTGILQLSLIDTDPLKLVSTLNKIAHVAFQEDTKNKSVEAAKTLAFLTQQLPLIKNSLNQAEVALNDYRAKNGKLNLSAETQIFLSQMSGIEKRISETRLKKNELLQYYTHEHPFIIELDSRQKQLQQELASLQTKMKKLPAADQIALSLARDVRVKNELYLLLAKKMQELQVIAAGTISDIRILSFAKIPDEPLPNRTSIKLAASLFVALGFGCLTALIRRALHRKVQDPRWIEQNLGLITAAIIPYSKKQNNTDRLLKKGLIGQSSILAFNAPHDLSIEALRSLRTHLQFSLQSSVNNVIAITGISPEVGKSFVASNFAYILADAGKRILLIDADIRRGHLFRYFNLNRSPGLSEVLTGTLSLQNAIQRLESPNLHILASGAYVGKPSELLMSERFNEIIQQVSKYYDAVVIDTAPILAVTDGVIVAKHAGINFLLIGSGMHHAEEIEFAVKRLYANNIKIQGVIYNNVHTESGAYGYGKYRYRYYYNYENA
jgi:tyrosine-protein kinase Etk/Wzc